MIYKRMDVCSLRCDFEHERPETSMHVREHELEAM